MNKIYTIGHSNVALEDFGALVMSNGITAIADVRTSPFSKFSPHFNIDSLKVYLATIGVSYVYLGKELGARSSEECCYNDNTVSYDKLAKSKLFLAGIQRLITGSEKYKIAAMCSEKDPTECHRTILVSRVLEEQGCSVYHILGNGEIETQEETLWRVVDLLKIPRVDMLRTEQEIIDAAYSAREKQIAYSRGN